MSTNKYNNTVAYDICRSKGLYFPTRKIAEMIHKIVLKSGMNYDDALNKLTGGPGVYNPQEYLLLHKTDEIWLKDESKFRDS